MGVCLFGVFLVIFIICFILMPQYLFLTTKMMFNQYLKRKGSAYTSYFPLCPNDNVTVKYKIFSIKTIYGQKSNVTKSVLTDLVCRKGGTGETGAACRSLPSNRL